MTEPRQWSDKLAAETIALQVKEIDRLHAKLRAETERCAAVADAIAAKWKKLGLRKDAETASEVAAAIRRLQDSRAEVADL